MVWFELVQAKRVHKMCELAHLAIVCPLPSTDIAFTGLS
jgi:hypothetical protein